MTALSESGVSIETFDADAPVESRGTPARPTEATGGGHAEQPGARSPLGRTFGVIGAVVAPTTLLTALMFYFGAQHASWFFRYFGVNYTILDLTAADYLRRSADGMFVPLLFTAGVAAAALWARRALTGRLPGAMRRAGARHGARACALLGLVALATALLGVLAPRTFDGQLALPALCLVAGTLLVVVGSRLHRAPDAPSVNGVVAEWAAAVVMIGVGLFWAVGNYSAAVGTGRGADMEAALPGWPDAVLYSTEPLNLPTDAATTTTCTATEGGYHYRYQGLKLVFASATQFLFLPGDWAQSRGPAVVLPRSESVRIEFRTTAPVAAEAPC